MSSDVNSLPLKSQRVLACVLCQQRKVKCDRNFPCANCTKNQAQCVPATLARRRRRRRFPERDLLDRLHTYEDLLRQNNIAFAPFESDTTRAETRSDVKSEHESSVLEHEAEEGAGSAPSTTLGSDKSYQVKNFWHTMNRGFRDSDNDSDSSGDYLREIELKQAWDEIVRKDDNLLFGSRDSNIDLKTVHPDTIHIFRLWQTYLENVNPLLKVTHAPTLQSRIIEAAGDLSRVDPQLEALMFGIYSTAVVSLTEEECQSMLTSSKQDLMRRFNFGCQQSLLGCGFLRTGDRDCLTALYLYLISMSFSTVPHSIASMLGIAFRIARRMGIHSEATLEKCSIFEAEMRRRLWWSLVAFDYRINEISLSRSSTLDPTWNCKIPHSVNDSDLRPEMQSSPLVQGPSSEALFAVVRSDILNHLRCTSFYLDFTNPALKSLAKRDMASGDSQILVLEQFIEQAYLRHSNQENSLHFMTLWCMRSQLAKLRLLEHLSLASKQAQTDLFYETAMNHALNQIECDTTIMSSPLTQRFRWFHHFYFPLPAYLQVARHLRLGPKSSNTQRAWKVLSDNYEVRFDFAPVERNPMQQILKNVILRAWEVFERGFHGSEPIPETPKMILSIRSVLKDPPKIVQMEDVNCFSAAEVTPNLADFSTSTLLPRGYSDPSFSLTPELQMQLSNMQSALFYGAGDQPQFSIGPNQIDWSALGDAMVWPGI